MNHLRFSWSIAQLEQARSKAIEVFRKQRLQEPLEHYLEAYGKCRGVVDELLEMTVDLSQLRNQAQSVLATRLKQEAVRYLASPPVSDSDLLVIAGIESLSPKTLKANPANAQRVVDIILDIIDRERFPWVNEDREPLEYERDRAAMATTVLLAVQRVATNRRNEGKQEQEGQVRRALIEAGLTLVPTRYVRTLVDSPKPGEFCMESKLGTRKADLIVGLWDNRILAIECKVSNSEVNSIKRLNNDAAAKAEVWRRDFGELQVVPTAVLSGVYKLAHLESAQERGLTLFWAHHLRHLTDWIESTRARNL